MTWLLQILERQSNFDDTLECVDRVEQSTVPVSFELYGNPWECIVVMCLDVVMITAGAVVVYAHEWR